jgi:hypothetical protein
MFVTCSEGSVRFVVVGSIDHLLWMSGKWYVLYDIKAMYSHIYSSFAGGF